MRSTPGAALVDRPPRRSNALDRELEIEQRVRRIAGGVLDREAGDTGRVAAATLAATASGSSRSRPRSPRSPAPRPRRPSLEGGAALHRATRRCRVCPATRQGRSWSWRAPETRAGRATERCRRPTGWESRSTRIVELAKHAATIGLVGHSESLPRVCENSLTAESAEQEVPRILSELCVLRGKT